MRRLEEGGEAHDAREAFMKGKIKDPFNRVRIRNHFSL